ncbi:hypothetical protein RJ640_017678 [Escallonia rubra]|uniref:Uncharacterized protein n=1 Tax=Escallonia rubra TaxID=112253 RepID=A0AA88RQV8_9ASTE|nr:hypothetical protein RJ640_017678 [Escallonia rubra]
MHAPYEERVKDLISRLTLYEKAQLFLIEVNYVRSLQELAFDAAKQEIVLLENNGSLPLTQTTVQKLAVVGPNANASMAMSSIYAGVPCEFTTLLQALSKYTSDLIYEPGCESVACEGRNIILLIQLDLDVFQFGFGFNFDGKMEETFFSMDSSSPPTKFQITGLASEEDRISKSHQISDSC